jgi:hypothetical protein
MKLHEEFKLFEEMWDDESPVSTDATRSIAEIKADIGRLEKELDAARAELRSAQRVTVAAGKSPKQLYAWDIYKTEADKGTWTSAYHTAAGWEGVFSETYEEAAEAGRDMLENNLEHEDPNATPDQYTVDVFAIPLSDITVQALEDSELEYLIEE